MIHTFLLAVDFSKCKMTTNGLDYNGNVSTTASGYTCQRWESQYPHPHIYYAVQEQARLHENYCRNPDHDRDLWCYTTDKYTTWDFCNVPICGKRILHVFFLMFLSHSIRDTWLYRKKRKI